MAERIRAHDWAATPLGPIAGWPQSLKTVVDLMLATAQPVYIGWGADLVSLYNDGYIPIAGAKHPASLGLPYREMWSEIWDEFRPIAADVMAGEARYFIDQPVALADRPDRPISWFTFSWTPLRAENGSVNGFYCVATETTERVLADRKRERDYRSLFEAIDEGYLLADVIFDEAGEAQDIAFVDVNPAATRIIGIDFKGRRLRDINPDYEEYWYQIFGRVARGGKSERLERYAGPSGRWYDFYIFKPDPDDRASNRVATLFHDISARKLIEERQAFTLELADALRPVRDPVAVQELTTRLLGEHLAVDRCYYAEFDWPHDVLHIHHEYTRAAAVSAVGSHPISAFQDLLQFSDRGEPLVCDAIDTHPLFRGEAAAYHARGTDAFILVPLVKHEVMVACMCVTMETPRHWTAGDVALASEVADRTWSAVERARAEAALQATQERYRLLFDTIDEGFMIGTILHDEDGMPIDLHYSEVNPAFQRQTGLTVAPGMLLSDVAPGTSAAWLETYDRIAKTSQPERFEMFHPPTDRWYEVFSARVDPDKENPIFVVFSDVTDRRRAENALRESEQRLQTLVEGVPQLVWRAVDDGHWTWASPQWTEFTGQSDADSHDLGWLDPVHPDDRERVRAIWSDAIARGEFHADYRLCHAVEGRYRWFQTRATPVRDDDRRIVEWLGTSTDVDDIRELQQRQQVLVAELQHRVRNILTVVRSVFGRTVEAGGDIAAVADHFRGRLDALARTQVVMTQTASGDVDLQNLIREELLSVGVSDGPDTTIAGPDIALPAKTAETIGLAIHELTTNAVKFGALQGKGGALRIEWTTNIVKGGEARLVITWTEQGVPAVAVKPTRFGFGSELIEEALPYRLGAETRLEFRGGGVRCTISMPLPPASAQRGDQRGTTTTHG